MMTTKNSRIDRLAEATGGRLHWNDPGMDDLEKGWEDFPLGARVEVRTTNNIWRKGTVVETIRENDRGISIECDEKWHDNKKFYGGRGATVAVFMNSRRGILSNLRKIDEPRFQLFESEFIHYRRLRFKPFFMTSDRKNLKPRSTKNILRHIRT
ncbi:MAG: hypothetical protein HYV52_00380 [Parcubacteria group bacterium]|nr:hypothetical protein [Parcubacteria group bacterium]